MIEKEAEKILEEFSKALEKVPELEETHYIVDNLNRTRADKKRKHDPKRILKNAPVDEEGNIIVERGEWTQ
ncbi:MAG TPA: Asp-tRNA(Asn) amidotransferase subunit GatC [Methanothermobacter sp.]|jgi:aspartyl-tRNA(Asn)/glutamyl-tRNA(Gln) amidotransferase subunit C|uniref:Asparaginyl/glutamyl-tRNA amidotransferase subunit C n=1 Tax=Methanothermobacter tenebrarum TaxID=680118 RepID=A0ABM7YDE9_9EURY|nr:Asp-tRNA(Asn) amidotransferase subunit GatC [Methanothermobacter tenebrarum]MBC7119277.1 Asp-tRNA(Asn) amidotransferase subunit GatC [Methanobacteriaceae archaeon]MDI6881663.1 Asp-tRNA(Asn) amidotransferase subunit GatC [Methanothermobacter sp.]MDX9693126.1 Asp-tRNA(Asn) amidotransferase subunit GatC [Methanothermobacter sp.]BDH79365.1 asparaginyl/glutamyl-tRNA amidotransferase subunit C [Methanothermobacter tenebrarum]HHW16113.1 Asp-tRNA(Asn) amidotransferase subunit GatC [Methanothermobac